MKRSGNAARATTTRTQKIGLALLGIIAAALTLEAGLRLAGWGLLAMQRRQNEERQRADNSVEKPGYRIMCVGESTTAKVDMNQNNWPEQLELTLKERNPGVRYLIFNVAVAGANLTQILRQLPDQMLQFRPDLVIAMCGINDQFGHNPSDLINSLHNRRELTNDLQESFFQRLRLVKLLHLLRRHWQAKNRLAEVGPAVPPNYGLSQAGQCCGRIGALAFRSFLNAATSSLAADSAAVIREDLVEANQLLEQKRFQEALTRYREVTALDPMNLQAQRKMAECLSYEGNREALEELTQEIIAADFQDVAFYRELGDFYLQQFNLQFYHRKEDYQNLNTLNHAGMPENPYILELAGDCLKQAAVLDSHDCRTVLRLAYYYWMWYQFVARPQKKSTLQDYADAERIFGAAAEFEPTAAGHWLLCSATIYAVTGRLEQAEAAYKKAIEMDSRQDEPYLLLANFYWDTFQREKAEECNDQAMLIRQRYNNPVFGEAYRKLYEIVRAYDARLALMQYPMRKVKELQDYFTGNEEIIFISNEETFKQALHSRHWEELFVDRFAFDFGHCSKAGNRMIAANVADVILQQENVNHGDHQAHR